MRPMITEERMKMIEKKTIFYSWQSDRKDIKSHIDKCLKRAIKDAERELQIKDRLSVDDSTKGKMGAVEIPATIMGKIDGCDLFVADLSFIGEYGERKLVSQNVMYELGYAIGKHTEGGVIMLFDEDTGKIKDLPFDISHRRVKSFSIEKDQDGEQLTRDLVGIISRYFGNADNMRDGANIGLDEEELDFLRLFKSMDGDKRIMVTRTLSGYILYPGSRKYDKEIVKKIKSSQDHQKMIANLDDLANKGFLKAYLGGNGTPNYVLAKLGYNAIDEMGNM